jgi:hypothetical protein
VAPGENMFLSSKQIIVILDALEKQYGPGYSSEESNGVHIGKLQARLSIMLEVALKSE